MAGSIVGLASLASIGLGIGYSRSEFLIRLVAIFAGFAGLFATRALLEAGYDGDHPDRFSDGGGSGADSHGIDTLTD